MKRSFLISGTVVILLAVFCFVSKIASSKFGESDAFRVQKPDVVQNRCVVAPLPDQVGRATSGESGEAHTVALGLLVDLAKRQQQFAPSDIKSFLSFISASKPESLTDGEWEERVNVVLNALRVQENEVPGLVEYLLNTAERHPSRILRLYAMQHLALWHHREQSVNKRGEIVRLFERLAEKDGGESAGAAVMFLNDLAGQAEEAGEAGEAGPAPQRIARCALNLAANPQAKQDVRISALHTCAERRMAEVLPAAREIAQDATAVLPLRKAAVFAIGRIGDREDIALLASLGEELPDLKAATEPAARAIEGR